MNKFQLFSIGLAASSLVMTSCDDVVDCGCDCEVVKVTGFELLDSSEELTKDQIKHSKVFSGSRVIVYGENLTDVTAVKFGAKVAELYPAYISDNQMVFKVPEGITDDAPAVFCTKACPTGFAVSAINGELAPPCATMCDNEFAKKTIRIKGTSFVEGMEVFFASKEGKYDIPAKDIKLEGLNDITVTIPDNVADGYPILVKNKKGERLSEFIYRNTKNLLITRDDPKLLDLFAAHKPDNEDDMPATIKEGYVKNYFKSENTDGNFTIFANIDGEVSGDWKELAYNPWSTKSNPELKKPKYASVFGPYEKDLLNGRRTSDFVLKFELFVPEDFPLKMPINIGFYDAAIYSQPNVIRAWCAAWMPSDISVYRSETEAWTLNGIKEFTTDDWITVAIPMSEFYLAMSAGEYCTSWSKDGVRLDPNAKNNVAKYAFRGDKYNGLSYADVFDFHYTTEFRKTGEGSEYDYDAAVSSNQSSEDMIGDPYLSAPKDEKEIEYEWNKLYPEAYKDGQFCPWSALAFNVNSVDSKLQNEWCFGIDNVRVVPNDDNNGLLSQYEVLVNTDKITRDFFSKPVLSCTK